MDADGHRFRNANGGNGETQQMISNAEAAETRRGARGARQESMGESFCACTRNLAQNARFGGIALQRNRTEAGKEFTEGNKGNEGRRGDKRRFLQEETEGTEELGA